MLKSLVERQINKYPVSLAPIRHQESQTVTNPTRRSFLTPVLRARRLARRQAPRQHADPGLCKSPTPRPALDGRITYYVYDARNRLTQMRDAHGTVTICHHDRRGNCISSTRTPPPS
jgi:YD repeat-containing protein